MNSLDGLDQREWLLTFGNGGFASGSIGLIPTRKYHGLLVASLDPPLGRITLLADLEAFVKVDGQVLALSSFQYPGVTHPDGQTRIVSFEAAPEIVWQFNHGSIAVERRITPSSGTNAVKVAYKNLSRYTIELALRPLVCHRPLHQNFKESSHYPESSEVQDRLIRITEGRVTLTLDFTTGQATEDRLWYRNFVHVRDEERGVGGQDDLFSPAKLLWHLQPGEVASITARANEDKFVSVNATIGDRLAAASEKFLVDSPKSSTIIAGFPWFADWGRDTMIALPGICLCSGRLALAKRILRRYGNAMEDGLIPNRFDEDGGAHYNTVDATLWFINALHLTLDLEWDGEFALWALSATKDSIDHHLKGTRFGIKADPEDGLLRHGEEGLQLTWMDAKVGDEVITPRNGKAVEVNGLWINALRICDRLGKRLGVSDTAIVDFAALAEASFHRKFLIPTLGYFADTIDPIDESLRPNQLIAFGLPFGPVPTPEMGTALQVIQERLLTPKGLRTLDPESPHYRGRFKGHLPELDRAYHQGTVWPWLLGPYVSAMLKVRNDPLAASLALSGLETMLDEYGMNGIAEVYDGDAPHRPGGCPWQAWSVACVRQARQDIENSMG